MAGVGGNPARQGDRDLGDLGVRQRCGVRIGRRAVNFSMTVLPHQTSVAEFWIVGCASSGDTAGHRAGQVGHEPMQVLGRIR